MLVHLQPMGKFKTMITNCGLLMSACLFFVIYFFVFILLYIHFKSYVNHYIIIYQLHFYETKKLKI